MLGIESQHLLRDFLKVSARYELQVEKQRQRLSLLRDYEPYAAFCRVNRGGNKRINVTEILNFLQ